MGCFFAKSGSQQLRSGDSPEATEQPVQFSWDKREKIDPKDFTIENLKGETVGRVPGTVNGQQFIIQNCEDCNIYVFDNADSITVDDCKNCRIFLGPIQSSVFIRDCEDCKVAVICQQFRTRDCKKFDVFLSCVTQPIIESTTGIKFGCFQFHYPELEGQFRNAGVSVYNNNWSSIHDFTPVPGENNFTLLPEDAKMEDYIPLPSTEQFSGMQFSCSGELSVVPLTLGSRRKPSDQSCLVVFFSDGLSHDRAKNFIKEMKSNHTQCVLVQSNELKMQAGDAQRVFGSDSFSMAVEQGPVIGFEYNGENCIQACQATLVEVSKGSTGLVFISSNVEQAAQQIENFYNFADMQMGA